MLGAVGEVHDDETEIVDRKGVGDAKIHDDTPALPTAYLTPAGSPSSRTMFLHTPHVK